LAKNIDAEAPPKAKLFVITPIGGPGTPQRRHADMVFNTAIIPACEAVDISPPDRADLIDTTSMISTNIFRNVEEADLAIADLTFLNPNVMYELGIRHAVEKPVIHIAQEGTSLPFDTSGHMTLFFDVSDWHSLNRLSRSSVQPFPRGEPNQPGHGGKQPDAGPSKSRQATGRSLSLSSSDHSTPDPATRKVAVDALSSPA
jgi:hypothetical protein